MRSISSWASIAAVVAVAVLGRVERIDWRRERADRRGDEREQRHRGQHLEERDARAAAVASHTGATCPDGHTVIGAVRARVVESCSCERLRRTRAARSRPRVLNSKLRPMPRG